MIEDHPVMPVPLGILGHVPQDILVLHGVVDLAAAVISRLLQGDAATRPLHHLQRGGATRLLPGRGSTPGTFFFFHSWSYMAFLLQVSYFCFDSVQVAFT